MARIKFTGDRYVDTVITNLMEWLSDNGKISDEDYWKFYDENDLSKYVEIVFEEFPITVDTPNAYYDVKYCWNKFIDTREGRGADDWLDEYNPVVDSAYLLDDLNNDVISDLLDRYTIETAVEEFCKSNPYGKKLSKKDRQTIVDAISDADVGEFENGYSFTASEFAGIEMTDHDGEHTYADVSNADLRFRQYAKDGKLTGTWFTDSYKDTSIYALIFIDLEELAKKAM